mmetsp:Transcript_47564/g.103534  ORF Transcript_47564/g.103534 Transcript_47564/m.103534 type:complete len:124 (+) Transcript_47564:1-372(+)
MTEVRRAFGIELAEHRHQGAEKLASALRTRGLTNPDQKLDFINGDITDASLWGDATVVFMLCTCFPDAVVAKVVDAVAARGNGIRLISGSFSVAAVPGLHLEQTIALPTTFSNGEPFYVYRAG